MKLTKKYIEKKYNCILTRTSGFDNKKLFWTAHKNNHGKLGDYIGDSWTLDELNTKLLILEINIATREGR